MHFHERFDIDVALDEARERFVNRALNEIFSDEDYTGIYSHNRRRKIATALGMNCSPTVFIMNHYIKDFNDCLIALETAHGMYPNSENARQISVVIEDLLNRSEVDLGIKWEQGKFIKIGAKILDDELVNHQLSWLRDQGYETVRRPFVKALRHLMEANRDDKLLFHVITDAYESLEALAKIVTQRPGKELSSNAELFVSKLNVSHELKLMIKEYIGYANYYRHAESDIKPRPTVSYHEAEYFVYITGAYIRLAISSQSIESS